MRKPPPSAGSMIAIPCERVICPSLPANDPGGSELKRCTLSNGSSPDAAGLRRRRCHRDLAISQRAGFADPDTLLALRTICSVVTGYRGSSKTDVSRAGTTLQETTVGAVGTTGILSGDQNVPDEADASRWPLLTRIRFGLGEDVCITGQPRLPHLDAGSKDDRKEFRDDAAPCGDWESIVWSCPLWPGGARRVSGR
jgi:hypothetical protein